LPKPIMLTPIAAVPKSTAMTGTGRCLLAMCADLKRRRFLGWLLHQMEGGVRLRRQLETLSREEFPATVLFLPDLQDAYM
jgi:hypothetical protein